MASAVHRAAVVGPDGAIAIRVPELAPGQRVRITVELEQESAELRPAIAVLAELPGPRLFHTAEAVDTYLDAEREAWNH
ncbi:MAG TPA: hypothetical protein VNL71_11430 [Chloroflexota bacterium]|nr:hypothetical protein [Chloroflexota bacterium]